jgi:hypothetical protein
MLYSNIFGRTTELAGIPMELRSIAFVYLVFGTFFVFVGLSIFALPENATPTSSPGLPIYGIVVMLISLVFIGLTLNFFKTELFGDLA